jgi:hypothetical protein
MNLLDLLTGVLGSPLQLTLEIGQIKLVLPKSKNLWGAQADTGVVWNKKPIQVEGRNGRYTRYRLLLGSFFLAESKLKTPLSIRGGKGVIAAGQIAFEKAGATAL